MIIYALLSQSFIRSVNQSEKRKKLQNTQRHYFDC